MTAGIRNALEEIRSSLYFVPAVMVAGAFGLSTVLLIVDGRHPRLGEDFPWLFAGTASAGRTLLATVASSLITVVAVAFSMTMVAFQQGASNFTPRVLRMFTRDRGNQVVLGMYIATFAYSLLVMRQIRGEDGSVAAFVPALSISVAIVLALVALGLLVYFIHHASRSLEVTWILDSILHELEHALARLFPERMGGGRPEVAPEMLLTRNRPGTTMAARRRGYLRRIDQDQLTSSVPEGATLVQVHPAIGDYLMPGMPLVTVYPPVALDDERCAEFAGAFALGSERSVEQDPLFLLQQLVDIAVKALSPGIHDPTTAEQAIDRLGAAIAQLRDRDFPPAVRDIDGMTFVFTRPRFETFVTVAFDQVRRAAAGNVHVTMYLIGTLARLRAITTDPARRLVLEEQIEAVISALPTCGLDRHDQAAVAQRAREALDATGINGLSRRRDTA